MDYFICKGRKEMLQNPTVKTVTGSFSKNGTKQFQKVVKQRYNNGNITHLQRKNYDEVVTFTYKS